MQQQTIVLVVCAMLLGAVIGVLAVGLAQHINKGEQQ